MSASESPAPIGSADLAKARIEPLRWVVERILPEGLTLLVGKPKLGKSWLALHMAVEVALGGRVMGQLGVTPTPVHYFALEDGQRRLQARQAIVYGPRPPSNDLTFALALPQLDKGGLEAVRAVAAGGAGLIIIDTFGRVQPPQAGNRNSYAAEYGLVGALQQIAQQARIAILLVHHERKSVEGDRAGYMLDKVLGTTGITGAADNTIILQAEDDGVRRLYLTGRDVEAQDFAYAVDLQQGTWAITENINASAECEEVLGLLRQSAPNALRADEIARALRKSDRTVRKHLKTLVGMGLVGQSAAGRYVAAGLS